MEDRMYIKEGFVIDIFEAEKELRFKTVTDSCGAPVAIGRYLIVGEYVSNEPDRKDSSGMNVISFWDLKKYLKHEALVTNLDTGEGLVGRLRRDRKGFFIYDEDFEPEPEEKKDAENQQPNESKNTGHLDIQIRVELPQKELNENGAGK